MYKIVFLSHVTKICDRKSLEIPININTIGEALLFLYDECPKLKPYLDEKPQELVLLMDSMNVVPNLNNSRIISSDLYVSPIIGGGRY